MFGNVESSTVKSHCAGQEAVKKPLATSIFCYYIRILIKCQEVHSFYLCLAPLWWWGRRRRQRQRATGWAARWQRPPPVRTPSGRKSWRRRNRPVSTPGRRVSHAGVPTRGGRRATLACQPRWGAPRGPASPCAAATVTRNALLLKPITEKYIKWEADWKLKCLHEFTRHRATHLRFMANPCTLTAIYGVSDNSSACSHTCKRGPIYFN